MVLPNQTNKISHRNNRHNDNHSLYHTNLLGDQTQLMSDVKDNTAAIKTAVELLDNAVDGNEIQVDIVSSALPSGAATEATLSALNAKVTACDTGAVVVSSSALPTGAATESSLSSVDGKITACDTGAVVVSSSALPSGAATESTLAATESGVAALDTRLTTTNSKLDTLETSLTAIETSVQTIDDIVKEEDAAHSSGDKGVMLLGVRQSTQVDFGADGDYVPISINDDGEIRVTAGSGGGGDASAANQTTMIGHLSNIETAVELIDNAISGSEMQVDVVSSALPSGASTSALQGGGLPAALTASGNLKVSVEEGAGGDASAANQTTMIGSLSTIAGDTTSIDGKITACNTGAVVVSSSALPSGAATESSLSSIDGKVTACNTGAVVVSSSALPTGAASASLQGGGLPAALTASGNLKVSVEEGAGGDASAANQTTMISSLSTIAGDTTSIDGKITACNTGAVVVSSSALPTGAALESTLSALNTKVTACDTGSVTVTSNALPSGASTSALQGGGLPAALTVAGNLKVSVEETVGGDASAANQTTMIGSLSTIAGDTTSLDGKVTACNTGNVTIASSALPTGAATESSLSSIDGKVTACNTGAVVVSSSALPSGAATESTLSTLNTKVLQGYDASIASGGTGLIQVLGYGLDSSGNLDALNVDNNGHLKIAIDTVENKGTFANIQNGTLNFGVTSSSVDVSDFNHAVFLYEDTNTSTFDDPVFEISMDNTNFYKASDQLFTSVRGSKREGTKEYKLHGITHVRIKNESTADNFTNAKATIVGTPN